MNKASAYERDLYDRLTCYTAEELISFTQRAHLSIYGRLALQLCDEQVVAAVELGRDREAAHYAHARKVIQLYVPEREAESVMGDTWTSSEF